MLLGKLRQMKLSSSVCCSMSTVSTPGAGMKVAVLGAAGGIGQPLSLLLKDLPSISHLALYDIANMGMAVDLAHISTLAKVTGHSGQEELEKCLENAKVVVIPAGVPRKPGMTRDDLFAINASIVHNLSVACAKTCPNAHLLIISNPVNSTVPIAVQAMKMNGIAQPRVYGITTLDAVRANTFLAESRSLDPRKLNISVVGGHSGKTIVPLFSGGPSQGLSQGEIEKLTYRVQFGGDEVVKAKAGGGSATLSMAWAAREFIRPFLEALLGNKGVVLNCFIEDESWKESAFLAGPVAFGVGGKEKALPLPSMNDYEKQLFQGALPELHESIQKGIDFCKNAQTKMMNK